MRNVLTTASMLAMLAAAPALAQTNFPPGPSSMPSPDMMSGSNTMSGPGQMGGRGMMPGPGPMGPRAMLGPNGPNMMGGPGGMPGPNAMGPRGMYGPNTGYDQSRGMYPAASGQDREFVEMAASAGLAEVAAGNLAMRRAEATAVREFGRWMVTDHSEMNDMLTRHAEQAGVAVPTRATFEDEQMVNGLRQFTGPEFDLRFIAAQTEAHKKAIELFKREAQSGDNPALRWFAQHHQRMLTQHLAQAEELRGAPESSTARSAQVTSPPAAPMTDPKAVSPKLHEGTTPALRHSLNEEGAQRIEREGK
jgi:putative membrane protein